MKPKMCLYVGSNYPHFHPAVGMRGLFGPTQYIKIHGTYHIILESVNISLQKKKSKHFFNASKYTLFTAKIMRILWRAAAKVTWAPRAALFVVLRSSIEQVS
jgi:hypothetical protein